MAENIKSIQYIRMNDGDYSFDAVTIGGKSVEEIGELVTSINGESTNSQYPSAKCLYKMIYGIQQRDYSKDYLTFEITSPGNIVWKATNTGYTCAIEYSKNGGEWTSITSNKGTSAPSISVVAGDKVQFRGNNATYTPGYNRYNYFSGTTCGFNVEGNIMSLINSTDFTTATTLSSSDTFNRLFFNCTGLTDASNLVLPATTLTNNCYYDMFNGCTGLTTAPELPATTLANFCYAYMFYGCTSLITSPTILPATTLAVGSCRNMFQGCTSLTTVPEIHATTLAENCCHSMFYGCTSLTTAPELPATTLANNCYDTMFCECTGLTTAPELPATTLANYCYNQMFYGCTSLTTAPELPATTLVDSCYAYMFRGCSNLTTAPELPATTLASGCYQNMFYGCTNLNYIKCLATDISASNCTYYWVSGVAASGTFVKNPAMSSWTTGNNGIPSNWTIQNA